MTTFSRQFDCPSGKITYPSLRWAEKFAQQVNRTHRHRVRAYFCPECGGWHLTSQKQRPLIRRNYERLQCSLPACHPQ